MSRIWNKTGLHALGHAVLTEPYEPEINRGLIYIPPAVADGLKVAENRVRILDVGPNAWKGEPARAKPGDVVLVSRYSGVMVMSAVDSKLYRMVNDNDIFCRIDEDTAKAAEEAA